MGYTGLITDGMLKCMTTEQKKPMGKAGRTFDECLIAEEIKLEKVLHVQIGQDLLRRGIEYGHAEMRHKSRFTKGWPDFTFTFNRETWHVECKVPGNGLDEDQRRVRDNILVNGGLWITVYSFADYAVIFHVERITGRME